MNASKNVLQMQSAQRVRMAEFAILLRDFAKNVAAWKMAAQIQKNQSVPQPEFVLVNALLLQNQGIALKHFGHVSNNCL